MTVRCIRLPMYVVDCDTCGVRAYPSSRHSALPEKAELRILELGWCLQGKGKHRCPDCVRVADRKK